MSGENGGLLLDVYALPWVKLASQQISSYIGTPWAHLGDEIALALLDNGAGGDMRVDWVLIHVVFNFTGSLGGERARTLLAGVMRDLLAGLPGSKVT